MDNENKEGNPPVELIVKHPHTIYLLNYEGTCFNCFCKVKHDGGIFLYLFERANGKLICVAMDSVICSYCGTRIIWFSLSDNEKLKIEEDFAKYTTIERVKIQ